MPVPVKNGRLQPLFRLWKKPFLKFWFVSMNSKWLFNRSLALRCCSLALCLLLSSGVGRAATQSEVQAAIEAALAPYQDPSGGFYTIPYSEQWENIGLMLATSDGGGSVADGVWGLWRSFVSALGVVHIGDDGYVKQILDSIRSGGETNLLADIFEFLDQSAASHFNESANWRRDWYETYGSALLNLKQNLDFVTFDNWQQVGSRSPVLSVFDEPASAKLLTLLRLLQDDIIPALQSLQSSASDQSSGLTTMGESISEAIDNLSLLVQGITEDWLTLEELETRDRERDQELTQEGEREARDAKGDFDYDAMQAENDATREVDNYQHASEELVETQDFDFDMETENPYDEFDTLSKDATDKFKEIVGDAQDYTYSGSDDLVLLGTPALDPELFPGLGVVKYNYSLHNGLRNWSQQSRRITSWAWRLLGFVMQLVLIVRFIAGAMSGFSRSEKTTSDF